MVGIQFENYYYEGEVNEKGEPHGHGIHHKDGLVFEGEYCNGKRNGFGVINYNDGNRLEGYYIDGKMNGPAKWYNGDRLTDEGYYTNDKRSGYWVTDDGGIHTEGVYVDGVEQGHWVDVYKDAMVEYELVDGKKNGPSIRVNNDDSSSACTYCDDLETGHGVDFFSDGSYVEGQYVKGRMEGYWTEHYPNGDIVMMKFRKGFPTGKSKVITNEGDEVSVGFKGGIFRFKGKTAEGMRFGMSMNDKGDGSVDIEDSDGTNVIGAYHEGKEYGQWSVSDKEATAELDLTDGKTEVIEYKEKKKGLFSRLFGKRK